MIFEMTIQVRVSDIEVGIDWYETLLGKKPDFIPHDGFAEWEIIPGCWLQVSEGIPTKGSGPLRFGTTDIKKMRDRLKNNLNVQDFEIHKRDGVPVKWATFEDPWGNCLGIFVYFDKVEQHNRMNTIIKSL